MEKGPVVTLLAGSSFEVILTFFALNRLGYAVLFLSTRLTASAYARLMDMAVSHNLIVHKNYQPMGQEICSERPGCTTIPFLQRSDWHQQPTAEPVRRPAVDAVREGKKIAWILHSSGSTGFPKPIYLSNMQCLANWKKSFALKSFCTSPLFHSHALMELGRAFYTRSAMYLVNPNLAITASSLLDATATAQPQMVSAVPYVLKLLAEKPAGIAALAKAQLVMYAGSSCPDSLGDLLVSHGVNLIANYGATETGQIMTSFRHCDTDKEWSYMRCWPPVAEKTLFDEIAPGVFECVALDGLPSKGPSNSKPPFSEKNPENSFRTSDLFTRHPDPKKSNYYKYLSRLDDRITLVNGEKVLPIPIEGAIRQHQMVREAAVFGFQQTMPGVLIFRSPDHGTELSDAEFLDVVWPAVEAANARAETFARIIRELVVIKPADCAYPRTDKGTFIRAQLYQQFAQDISDAYTRMSSTFATTSTDVPKLTLSVLELEDWLLSKFREDLSIPLPNAQSDIFAAGVDSLQTTRIWRAIKKEIDLGSAGDKLGTNIVFERGNVASLARYLYQVRTGETTEDEVEDEEKVMRELIQKYSSQFVMHQAELTNMPGKETVVVTGATGNLGAFIVAELAQRNDVETIYCLVRALDMDAASKRLFSSLEARKISLTPAARAKLRAVPADLSQPSLGLDDSTLIHLRAHLTCIIHSAWAVNFNLGVRSFEAQHIAGTAHLINLCLSSLLPQPARFFFCSSVSVASGTPAPARIPESLVRDFGHVQGMGYGRSKLVTEYITANAARENGMQGKARVLRIGQLCGDTGAAQWNDTEAIALMVRSALTTGCLPRLAERPSWLPVDVCAKAVVGAALHPHSSLAPESDTDGTVYHLLNPQTFSWTHDLLPFLHKHPDFPAFEIVPTREWLDRLGKSEPDPVRNPSSKLLDFWRRKYGKPDAVVDESAENGKGLHFELEKTLAADSGCGEALGGMRDPVRDGLMKRIVSVWMGKWTRTAEQMP